MRISGHPIVFDSVSVNLGGFYEVIRAGAVDRVLRDPDADVVALRNHDSTLPLARRSARTLKLQKDARGLLTDLSVDESVGYVADLLRIIERGDARGGSFAFTALDDMWSLRDGEVFREVVDMNIREISVGVSFPAYASTALSVGTPIAVPAGRSVKFAEAELKQARLR